MDMHTYIHMHVHTNTHTHTLTLAHTCMHTHACTPVCIHACAHACTHACTHIIHSHSHKHTYIHTIHWCKHNRSGQVKLKPVVIDDYNQHMLGVDKLDQFASYYSFLHKSVKWWRKIFFWMLEVAVINSYIIYKKLVTSRGRRPMTHKAFRQALIDYLSEPLRSQRQQRARRGPPPGQNLERLHQVRHFPEKG